MKKFLALSLSAALLLALLCACTAGEPENTANSSDPTAGASASVSPTDSSTDNPQEPSLTLPSDDPGDETPVEPAGPSDSDVNLEDFLWLIAETYQFPGIDANPPDEWVSQYYPGLASIPAVQRIVAMGMMSPPVCQIVLVQVVNSSDVQKVCDILDARIAYMIETDAAYNVEHWENASVEVHGNYIMMIAHARCDDIVSDFHAIIDDPSYVPAPPSGPGDDDPESGGNVGGGFGGGFVVPVPGGTGSDGSAENT